MNNSTLIVATEKCKPQRVSPTPWLVQQSKNQRGSAPPNLMTGGGAIAPPAPLVLTPVLEQRFLITTRPKTAFFVSQLSSGTCKINEGRGFARVL